MYELCAFCHTNNDANNAGISIFNIPTWRYSSIAMCKSESQAHPKEEQRAVPRVYYKRPRLGRYFRELEFQPRDASEYLPSALRRQNQRTRLQRKTFPPSTQIYFQNHH